MQFALIIYKNAEFWSSIPKIERERLSESCLAWHAALMAKGTAQAAVRLHDVGTAATVRGPKPGFTVTDGPFAETKEVLAGIELVECASQAEALALAQTFPGISHGDTVEVRQMYSDDQKCGH
ncbi:MAG: YciI family protein [Verrucomicrobiota bacterium]